MLAEAWTQRLIANRDAVDDQAEEVHPSVVFTHTSAGWVFTAGIELQPPPGE